MTSMNSIDEVQAALAAQDYVCGRALAESRTHHSLSTCSRVLIFLCHITQKATSELLDIKLAFEEDKFTMSDDDKGDALQPIHIHTALSW